MLRVVLSNTIKQQIYSRLSKDTVKITLTKILVYKDSTIQWTSSKIAIQILPQYNIYNLLREYNIDFSNVSQFGSAPNTYIVELIGIEDKSIEYSNRIYESGKVIYSQPVFYRMLKPMQPYYPNQWGLNNIDQYGEIVGIDINAPEAWAIATGIGAKVAVLDEGVDLTHPDLVNNLLHGYDATDGKLGGANGSHKGNDAHGTACAGIIASSNNNQGVVGVAYNSKIIPIRIAYGNGIHWITNDMKIADGLRKAWQDFQGDVLSNSWGGGANSELINTEIDNALVKGRNGKGAIVVFASGNYNNNILYPANSNPSILVVGAMSPCGERKNPSSCDGEMWGSCYGSQLDVVAPGVLIPTTDLQGNTGYNPNMHIHTENGGNKITSDYTNQDYTVWFNGTSSACPHVSGIAALILSVNPDLTGQQVRDIIEKTAQKVRTDLYTYTNNTQRPNGAWNNEMGYGLVDAYAAVKMAKALNTPADLLIRDYMGDDGEEPGYNPNDFLCGFRHTVPILSYLTLIHSSL